ncbi:hypothetical protein N799_08130 [Lysobacter arseniciresistens ZS79]|uniref:DUF4124 domain-containing protein n=1 Tax=Lysobacter arseniciresistens ZS79 TaxID=913325 RepID=A0A0A0F2Q5_9GAMM|nr:hypothetical protein [Lysobacter arseniciresistens]KGM57396.1 hypothetical protein N799_08130 [Lysobacter arseniciresistens ZS79]
MNRLPFSIAAATVLAASAMPCNAPAQSAGIQRCIAPDGTAIYTDKACAAFGAEAAPMSGALVSRLVHDGADTGAINFTGQDGPRPVAVARRSAASGCARSTTQLAMDLHGAWGLGDVNRIAESYHWVGMDSTQARSVMERLDRLSAATLWDTQFFDARIGSGAMQFADASVTPAARDGNVGIMQLVFAEGSGQRVQDLEVRRYRGCYFVRF